MIFFNINDVEATKAKKNINLINIDSVVNFNNIFPKIVPIIIYIITR